MGPLLCISHHSPCHDIRGCEESQTTLRTPWKRVLHLRPLRLAAPVPSAPGGPGAGEKRALHKTSAPLIF